MKFYLASRYSRRQEMLEYANDIQRQVGGYVTSRWILGNHQVTDADLNGDAPTDTIERRKNFAEEDLHDLRCADVVISFTEVPHTGATRGGRHVEFGVALATGKRCIIVGPRENVFHCLDSAEHYQTWEECLNVLKSEFFLQHPWVRSVDEWEALKMGIAHADQS